jgi:hypothetical protein
MLRQYKTITRQSQNHLAFVVIISGCTYGVQTSCHFWQLLPSFMICLTLLFYAYMKKKINASKPDMPVIPQYRSIRRFVKKLFVSFIKCQSDGYEDGFQRDNEKIIAMLQDLQDSIEIIARQINRWVELGK